MLHYKGWWDGSWHVQGCYPLCSQEGVARERKWVRDKVGWVWKLAQWLPSPEPATMSCQGHGMDLPPSQSRTWSLSVKIPAGACCISHKVGYAFDTLRSWSYRDRLGFCLPLSSSGHPSPWCRFQLSGHVLHGTVLALQLSGVKLHSWRLFVSDTRWFSPNCFSQERFFFFLRQTLFWWLISPEGFTIYSSFLVSAPSPSCGWLLLLFFVFPRNMEERGLKLHFSRYSFALISFPQNLCSFEEKDKNKAMKACRRKKWQHSFALAFILYVEIPSFCCLHLEGDVHWSQRVSVGVTGIRVSFWFISAQRTTWGQDFAMWKGKWCRTVFSSSCRSSSSGAALLYVNMCK